MDALVAPTAAEVAESQLLMLEQQLAAISAVVNLIERDFRALLAGEDGESPEVE